MNKRLPLLGSLLAETFLYLLSLSGTVDPPPRHTGEGVWLKRY